MPAWWVELVFFSASQDSTSALPDSYIACITRANVASDIERRVVKSYTISITSTYPVSIPPRSFYKENYQHLNVYTAPVLTVLEMTSRVAVNFIKSMYHAWSWAPGAVLIKRTYPLSYYTDILYTVFIQIYAHALNRRPPPFIIKLLYTKIGEIDDFHMHDLKWDFEPIIMHLLYSRGHTPSFNY